MQLFTLTLVNPNPERSMAATMKRKRKPKPVPLERSLYLIHEERGNVSDTVLSSTSILLLYSTAHLVLPCRTLYRTVHLVLPYRTFLLYYSTTLL